MSDLGNRMPDALKSMVEACERRGRGVWVDELKAVKVSQLRWMVSDAVDEVMRLRADIRSLSKASRGSGDTMYADALEELL